MSISFLCCIYFGQVKVGFFSHSTKKNRHYSNKKGRFKQPHEVLEAFAAIKPAAIW